MSINVVILDDDKEARDHLENLLKDFDDIKLVGSFESSKEAYPIIVKKQPDFLLLDIKIGEENGIELAEKLKIHEIHTKVIFVSANNTYAIDAIKLSAFDYLLKPVDKNELRCSILRYKAENQHNGGSIDELKIEYNITNRELQVLEQLTKGFSLKEVAASLNISILTAKTHRQNIYKKLKISNICELTIFFQAYQVNL